MSDHTFDELFARYSPLFRPLSALELLRGAGGLSGAKLWRYSARRGELVLRGWPPHGLGQPAIARAHRWLARAAGLGFVAVPVPDTAGQSLQQWRGTLWEIAPWLPGQADLSQPPGREHVRLAFSGLAAFHGRLADEQVEALSPGLENRHEEIRRLLDGGFDVLEVAIERESHRDHFCRSTALQWLALARELAPALLGRLSGIRAQRVRLQPVLRDARPEHFLFEGDRLSGLVDFGAMDVESVAADLARLLGEWLGGDLDARASAIDSYEQIRPLGPGEASLIAVFEATASLLMGERWARWHYLEGRNFGDPRAVANGLERGLARLDRLAREIAGSGPSS